MGGELHKFMFCTIFSYCGSAYQHHYQISGSSHTRHVGLSFMVQCVPVTLYGLQSYVCNVWLVPETVP